MNRCPSPVDLERSFIEPDREIDRHIADCKRCGTARAEYESLRGLLDELPYEPMTGKESERVRVGLVAAARVTKQRSPTSWGPWLVAAAAAVAMFAGLTFFERPSSPPPAVPSLAEVPAPVESARGKSGAWTRTIIHHDGEHVFEVPSLGFSSLLVKTGDAEILAERARFEVVAKDGRLERISVIGGIVELRKKDGATSVLAAGEAWASEVEVEPEPASAVEPRSATAKAPERPAFSEGWRAFRRGDYDAAIRFFDTAAAEDGPFSEDARYWRAVATLRLGKNERAAELLEEFLERHPSSARADEAQRLLSTVRR